ncbi:SR-related and CTD-associated factor 4 isoform X1 [Pelobates fuscus]|uniref:SR-related and CTD-associated factor 4 isoform X1 n=1 Tax=Pelobates fuscus TaxID=191477 RepID=UPI002FE466DF
MDAVNAFNQELFSLMDMKPPISRAKMILITKSAIKAIKLYKHVVQIVEKFIKKCRPEYKVPGLYVIDSIVRQSRHQFGIDKDVFGPRFIKNLTATFQCLYLCPTEDKSKIVRVLNLWQKNGVFKIEIIQPLLDMAAGALAASEMLADNSANDEGSSPPLGTMSSEPSEEIANLEPAVSVPQLPNPDAFAAVAQLFQTTQGQQLQQILQTFQQPPKPQSPAIDENVLAQVQAITSQLNAPPHQPERKTAFDKLLDRFDYDDEPEATEDSKKESSSPPPPSSQPPFSFSGEGMQTAFTQMPGQMPNMEQFQPMMMGMPQESLHHQAQLPPNGQMLGFGMIPTQAFSNIAHPVVVQESPQPFQPPFQMPQNEVHVQKELHQEAPMELEQPSIQDNKRHQPEPKSASRSPKRRRSRSSSRSRRSRHRRSRSRSRDRRRHSPKSRSQERRDRERKLKGLPPIKSETVSVCSTTLWVGQLDKRTSQQDVANLLEEFGPIESINMIPPRGCAYIVMVHRLDAYRALHKLSRGSYKVGQKAIKIAWALNKGIKADFKQYWDVEIGVTYIPWSKVKPEELQAFCEGGMLDNETLRPEWKSFNKKAESNDVSQNGGSENKRSDDASPASQPLPLLSLPIRTPLAAMSLSAPQPVTSLPPHQAMTMVQPQTSAPIHHQGLPPPQGLALPQGVPPLQGLTLPQGIHPQGLTLPQGMPMPQGIPLHQPVPGVGAMQPHFPGPISIPPPGFAPGVPPPPFMRPGFNPMQLPPGFLPPPGLLPPMTPVSIPPPTSAINIPTSTAGGQSSDATQEQAHGNAIQTAPSRESIDSDDSGNGFESSAQGGPNNAPGPVNPHLGASQAAQSQGPPSEPQQGPPPDQHQGPPSGPHQGPSSGPQHELPSPHQGPPSGHHQGPPSGHHQGPPSGHHQGPPSGHHQGPPSGHHQGPHSGPHYEPQGPHYEPQGPHYEPHGPHYEPHGAHQGPGSGPHYDPQGPHSGPHYEQPGPHQGPHSGPHYEATGPHQGPHSGPHYDPHGPHQGAHSGPHHGPPSGPHYEPPGPHHGPHSGPGTGQSTGLLGARPGLIPLQRPPGVPPPHRFQSMPHRQMPPHMMHRGPPGQGGYGMRGPFPPQGHFSRQGGPGGHGPEDREGRQFRNDRPGFNPERERYGRRPFGNRNEDEREYFDNRLDEHDHERSSNRGRRNWGRGSPDHERYRDQEERSRWSMGREREPEPYRGMPEMRESRKHDMLMEFDDEHESFKDKIDASEKVPKFDKVKEETSENKPAEEVPAKASEQKEKDSVPTTESPH